MRKGYPSAPRIPRAFLPENRPARLSDKEDSSFGPDELFSGDMELQREQQLFDVGPGMQVDREGLLLADRLVVLVLEAEADRHDLAFREIALGHLDLEDAVDFLAVIQAAREQVID